MVQPADTAAIIQHILTPAVMISSAALFLLGLQNKFSSLFSRFRMLNQERRACEAKGKIESYEKDRLENVKQQLERLLKRIGFVKNAILLIFLSILAYLLTSASLFINLYSPHPVPAMAVFFFIFGMTCFFAACVLMILETALAYNIIQLERKS